MPRPCGHDEAKSGCITCVLYDHSPMWRAAADRSRMVQRDLAGAPEQPPSSRYAPRREPSPPVPAGGVGTELKLILSQLGIPATGCGSCSDLALEMDRRGVAACAEPDYRRTVVDRLRTKMQAAGWAVKLKAASLAAWHGMTFVDPGDVPGSLYDEALRRAEAKELTEAAEGEA